MKKIESLVRGIVKRYGTPSPFELCERMGIPVLHLDLPERVRGFCLQSGAGRPVIVLAEFLPAREREYCCAHELGHALLHPGLNAQTAADLTNLCMGRLENEADYFAACLFIDPNLEEWKQNYCPLTVETVASLTGLPERIVRLRFHQ